MAKTKIYRLTLEFECDDNINTINKLMNSFLMDALAYNVGLKGLYSSLMSVERIK